MNAQRIANQHHATFEGARKEFSRVVQNHFVDVNKMVGISAGDFGIWLCGVRGSHG
jgi:hypothetical protein